MTVLQLNLFMNHIHIYLKFFKKIYMKINKLETNLIIQMQILVYQLIK